MKKPGCFQLWIFKHIMDEKIWCKVILSRNEMDGILLNAILLNSICTYKIIKRLFHPNILPVKFWRWNFVIEIWPNNFLGSTNMFSLPFKPGQACFEIDNTKSFVLVRYHQSWLNFSLGQKKRKKCVVRMKKY